MAEENAKPKIFKYNMSFYYQSTIIYFVAFLLYTVIRGEFVEDSFTLITNDPIIWAFGFVVLYSIISLLYNLYKNKYLEITPGAVSVVSRFRKKVFKVEDMLRIKISRKKRDPEKRSALRLIRVKVKSRRRPLIIRPYDYENENELLKIFHELKLKIDQQNI
jgi:hypothetical protein